MRTRIPCAAENRIRLWQKIRRHSDSFGAVEVNIGQPIGGFAHKNADVLGSPVEKARSVVLGNPQGWLPRKDRYFCPERNWSGCPVAADVAEGDVEGAH